MAKRKSLKDSDCPVARALDIIGDRWCLLLVRDAFDGMRRFGQFQKSLGVARNILTDRLQALVEAEVFAVAPASDGSAYQEYVLTAKGEKLFPLIVGLRQWGEAHLFDNGEAHSVLVERASGRPVLTMYVSDGAGRPLTADDTLVRKVASSKVSPA